MAPLTGVARSQSVATDGFTRLWRVADGRELIDAVRAFLTAPRCAVLSTLGSDGAPRQIVIHYLLGDDHLRINGHRGRRWVANLRRDPRASLIVHDDADYLHYVSIRGTATLLDDGDVAVGEAMSQAERYGEDPLSFAGQPRASFRIDIERLTEYG
jgi:PPOX class probable F420-dependent enzyme